MGKKPNYHLALLGYRNRNEDGMEKQYGRKE
jgi:hypothetical protein